jgi:CheY-like chemotaxis protein
MADFPDDGRAWEDRRGRSADARAEASDAVLVVEDTPEERALLELGLRQAGYHTAVASDGTAALRMLDRYRVTGGPSLIVLDMLLPRTRGIGVLQYLRAVGYRVPVVAISASAAQRAAALAAGAQAALAKPIDMNTLLGLVSRYRWRGGADTRGALRPDQTTENPGRPGSGTRPCEPRRRAAPSPRYYSALPPLSTSRTAWRMHYPSDPGGLDQSTTSALRQRYVVSPPLGRRTHRCRA